MTRARSALAQIGGLVLATILLVQTVSFGVVMTTPVPAPPRMHIPDVAAALASDDGAARAGLERRSAAGPPEGSRAELVELALARRMAVPRDRLRATWVAQNLDEMEVWTWGEPDERARALSPSSPGRPRRPVVEDRAILALSAIPLPAFVAALRADDGSWTVVRASEPFFSGWRLRVLISFALSALLLAPLGWLAARNLTRPLRRLAAGVGEIGLDEGEPLRTEGPGEVRAVGAAIDRMRNRIAAQSAERTRMVAAMAHDIRTPLTGLRLRIEKAPPPDRARMAEDIARMEALIAAMLAYAQGGESREQHVAVDLSELLRDCAEAARLRSVELETDLPAGIEIQGEPMALRRAVTNLIDNAHFYAGRAELSLRCAGDRVLIQVRDHGPGIPDGEINRVIAPFERGERSRNRETGGAGLGLAIVRDVAARHGGRLLLSNPQDGGLLATMELAASA